MFFSNRDDACKQIAIALRGARHVLVATHTNPDGDAIGSAFALAHLARHCGAEVRIFLPAGLPRHLSWMPLPAPLAGDLAGLEGWAPDLLIFADCGDAGRAGPEMEPLARPGSVRLPGWGATRTVNIDHHVSNDGFADLNWVEAEAAATGELVGALAEYLGVPLSGDLGEAVYLALVMDTGDFTYSNTSAGSLGLASRIAGQGLNIGAFTDKRENIWSLDRMHLWGRLLSKITLHAEGRVACIVVRRVWLDELGLGVDALEGFASWLRRIRGVRVGLFVRENKKGQSKISLRSMGDFDVQAVCALYGGGGHAAAAGAELAAAPEKAAELVLNEIKARIRADVSRADYL